MKRLFWTLMPLLMILMLLPGAAAGDTTVEEMYLARSAGDDYAAYLHALGDVQATAETMVLYESAQGDELAEGESITITITVPEDVFGYPVLTYAMTGSNILDNGYTLQVDGAGYFKVYWKIILPMIKPALATVAILSFQTVWNNTETSTMYTNVESMRTLTFYMNTLASNTNAVAGQGMAAAASLIMFLPNLILFILCQSNVMNTMAHSGLK